MRMKDARGALNGGEGGNEMRMKEARSTLDG